MNRILKLQKRAARIILNADYDTPSVNMFKKLNWMTGSQRFFFQNCILPYKVLNNLSPQYLAYILKCKKTIHNYQLRRSVLKHEYIKNKDELPKVKLEVFKRSFSYNSVGAWNELPIDVKLSETLSVFKQRCKAYIFSLT